MTSAMSEPGALTLSPDGTMGGRTAGYQKFLGDMAGVYRDERAYQDELARRGADHLVYSVEEHRAGDGAGALIVGTSTLLPGSYGREFAVTRGHLHGIADRAELYHCLSGHGVMLLETVDGQSRAVELTAGKAVHVPGHWVHRSVNVGDQPFVTVFCYAADAGQNYDLISRAGGMANLIVRSGGGWASAPNPDHTGYRP
jgi:glucose-6-phosphate isomerase